MKESGSEGLDEFVVRESKKGGYFDGMDCVGACKCSTELKAVYLLNQGSPTTVVSTPGLLLSPMAFEGFSTIKPPSPDLLAISTLGYSDAQSIWSL